MDTTMIIAGVIGIVLGFVLAKMLSRPQPAPPAGPKVLSLEELTSRVGANDKCGGGLVPRPAGGFYIKCTNKDCDGECCGYLVQSDDGGIREVGCECVASAT